MPDAPLMVCYDGSDDARHAIEHGASLFSSRSALVLGVWQGATAVSGFGWTGASPAVLQEVFDAAQQSTARAVNEGLAIAEAAGLTATPLVVEARGPIWAAIVEAGDAHDVAAILLGARGLTRLQAVLLGSVSSGVVQHATRPTLVTPRP